MKTWLMCGLVILLGAVIALFKHSRDLSDYIPMTGERIQDQIDQEGRMWKFDQ